MNIEIDNLKTPSSNYKDAATLKTGVVEPDIIRSELETRKSDQEVYERRMKNKSDEIEEKEQNLKIMKDNLAAVGDSIDKVIKTINDIRQNKLTEEDGKVRLRQEIAQYKQNLEYRDKPVDLAEDAEIVRMNIYATLVEKERDILDIERKIERLKRDLKMIRSLNENVKKLIKTLESDASDETKKQAIRTYHKNLETWYITLFKNLKFPFVSPMLRLLTPLYRVFLYNPFLWIQGKETIPITDAHKGEPVINRKNGVLGIFFGGKSKRKTSRKKNKTLRKK